MTTKTLTPPTTFGTSRPSPQVKLWATCGALSLAVITWSWGRWLFSGELKPQPPGPDDFSGLSMVYLRFFEISITTLAVYFFWRYVIKPVVRYRTLGLDSMIILGSLPMWWYDPIGATYFQWSFSYNAYFWNFGSWVAYIPGWQSPNLERFAEPPLIGGSAYIWWVWGSILIGCAVLRKLRSRFPWMSNLTLFTILGLVMIPIDFFFEVVLAIIPGLWAYPGTVGELTLFPGERYQFPLYEPILVAAITMGWTMMRWFRDDRGRSFVQRGVDELRVSERAKTFVSFLAVTGFVHAVLVVGYMIPVNLITVKNDSFAEVPSYLRAGGVCGQGTDYACPDKVVPIPKKGSLHITPDDPRLPEELRERQKIGGGDPAAGY